MSRERWEVREPLGYTSSYSTREKAVTARLRACVVGLRIVRVRVFRVASVYAWRRGGMWWDATPYSGWVGKRTYCRTLYPTRAAALAARPSADAVLVRIRMRVNE